MVNSVYAQSPSCSDVEQSDITISPATCEGNGSIVAPAFANAFYTLIGENVSYQVGPQNDPSFISLSPGKYTLRILCEGSVTPTEITGLEVVSNWQQLSLALTPAIACPGQGTVKAVASFGYNKGVGAVYEFTIWQGSAGVPDNDPALTWVSPSAAPLDQYVFAGLSTGNYNVRVRDNCGNIWTQSVSVGSAGTPTVNLNRSSAWVCKNGKLVKRVTLNANNIAENVRWTGYKYKVEYVAGTGNCGTQASLGTITGETAVTEANMANAVFDLDNIPVGAGAYRITTISPCGEVSYNCQSVTGNVPTLTLRRTYGSCATPNSDSNTRLTYVISQGSEYTIAYPATLTFTGQGSWAGATVTVASSSDLNGILANVPISAYTVTATLTDGCGTVVTATSTNPGIPAGNPSFPSVSYNRTCVDFDHVNLDVSFNGAYVGVGETGTTYKLYNAADDSEVATGTLTSSITNTVRFSNIPATGTYYIKIAPPAGSGCSEQKTVNFTLPTGNNYPGARIVVNPTIEQNCTEETSIWTWKDYANNFQGTSAVRFKVWKVGDDPVNGPFVRNVTSSSSFTILPGEYLWSITNDYSDDGCDRVLNAPSPVTVGTIQWIPTIEKSVASTCQDENGQVLTSGIAILEFAGNGPFRIEQRDAAGPVNSWSTVAGGESVAGPTFEINNLESGKTYIFRVVDQCGRSVTQQVTIRPLSPRIINRDAVQPCVGSPYVLQGVDYPGATYVWTRMSDNQVVSNTKDLSFPNYTAANAGQYKLTLRLSSCLVRETTVTLGTEGCGQSFPKGSLGDYVWFDANYDGLQDSNESPAPGVPVTLQGYVGPSNPTPADLANNSNWTDMETKSTDPDGKYLFDDLETGYYRVRFGNVDGYEYTGYQTGGADANNRGNNNDSNAGEGGYSGPVYIDAYGSGVAKDNMTIDAGLVAYGSIGDYVWFDQNLNGIQDQGEAPVGGVTVKLYKKDGDSWVPSGTTTTDNTGKYLFDKLKPGTYQVEFVAPEGKEFTQHYVNGASSTEGPDSDADRTTGKSGEITINVNLPKGDVGRDNMTIDAGLIPEGALPVKLSHFNAEKTGEGAALLTWSTTEEANSSHFDVLQSADGANWQMIGRVEAKGSSLGTVKYNFTDAQPARGMNYYRLKMVDRDGSFERSNIRKLVFEGTPLDLTVYPNPISDKFSIKTGAREKISKVELFDSNGRLTIANDRYAEGDQITVKGLSAGTYVLRITMANGTLEIRKIVISNK